MAFSLESRLPFLDYRLVEFIFSLSTNKRFRGNETKWILRKAMKNINIDAILDRKDKIGFATPESEWAERLNIRKSNLDFKTFIFNRWILNEKFSF
jgi:asparagine synthase (glutamine-hydrolysing)